MDAAWLTGGVEIVMQSISACAFQIIAANHSALTPVLLMTLPQRSNSLLRKAPNSSGVESSGSALASAKLALISGTCKVFRMSPLSFFTIAGCVADTIENYVIDDITKALSAKR